MQEINESVAQMDFQIKFHMQTVKNKKVTTPFKIVFQTPSKSIEKRCVEQWPYLMQHQKYSTQQLKELQKMKAYIKNRLSRSDKNYIHKYFYDTKWFEPFRRITNMTSIELTDYNCKIWTDKEVPFLEISGEITLDMRKLFDLYFKRKFLKLETEKTRHKFHDKVMIRFQKPLPLYVTFRGGQEAKKVFANLLREKIDSRRPNDIKKKFEKQFNLKKLETFKKDVEWDRRGKLVVEINDTMKMLKIKAKENVLPLAGGYLLYRKMRGH